MLTEQQGHILVVDDNAVNRLTLARSLELQGHSVALAEGGQQALDMVRAGSYDVVLLDIVMPDMDGFQVLERMKAEQSLRDIPVIVISALEDVESAVRCIELGAEDYLPKPFDPVLLRARLRASLQKKKLRDLEVAYLHQEVMLRENEKLATLGKLSAGMAHELNNPAAAALRSADQLKTAVAQLEDAQLRLSTLGISTTQHDTLVRLGRAAHERARHPNDMGALAQSDRESLLEDWLEKQGIEPAWEYAPTLASMGYEI